MYVEAARNLLARPRRSRRRRSPATSRACWSHVDNNAATAERAARRHAADPRPLDAPAAGRRRPTARSLEAGARRAARRRGARPADAAVAPGPGSPPMRRRRRSLGAPTRARMLTGEGKWRAGAPRALKDRRRPARARSSRLQDAAAGRATPTRSGTRSAHRAAPARPRVAELQYRLRRARPGRLHRDRAGRAARARGRARRPRTCCSRSTTASATSCVDEFQDTSQSQFELLEKLTSGWEPRRRPHALPRGRPDAVDLPLSRGGGGALPARAGATASVSVRAAAAHALGQLPLAGRHRRLGELRASRA